MLSKSAYDRPIYYGLNAKRLPGNPSLSQKSIIFPRSLLFCKIQRDNYLYSILTRGQNDIFFKIRGEFFSPLGYEFLRGADFMKNLSRKMRFALPYEVLSGFKNKVFDGDFFDII